MNSLAALMSFLFPVIDYQGPVGVEAAYVIVTRKPEEAKCCGRCTGGVIVHGDGHTTDCPCPKDCKCKTAVKHPPIIIKGPDKPCPHDQCPARVIK